MSLLETIDSDTKAQSIVVYYNDAEFVTFKKKDLILPLRKYQIIFKAVEQLLSELDPKMKEVVTEDAAFKSVFIAMSDMMSEESLQKFIESDPLLQFFTVKERFKRTKNKE